MSSRWAHVVEEYSSLGLTYPSDRLPAIAGVAKQFMQGLPLQGVSKVVDEASTCCSMHASRISINTPLQLTLIKKTLIECTILRI